ncbi:MAG: hypothetical protein WCK58_03360 [Chloroflexota bacterium]
MGSISFGSDSFGYGFSSYKVHCPEPFDALNGTRLGGGQGSHPLHGGRPAELVSPASGNVAGEITLDHPVRVGEGVNGRIRFTATGQVHARGAALRLVGLRLVEEQKSRTHKTGEDTERTEYWVEANGSLFVEDAFTEPVIPATLEAGQTFETTFMVPAPRLGPPSAHLGEAIVAWALQVRWDVAMGGDAFLAILLPVAQHPDLIRAGVGKQGGMALLDAVDVKGATIAVTTPLPAAAGSTIGVRATWPGAPGGKGRIELHRRTNAPNGQEGIVASAPTDAAALTSGSAIAELVVPEGCAPSFDGAGLEVTYIVRVLVDRRFMPDAAIERPVAIS